ncbi:MAG: MlaD family protein [Solirubrobacteraceae bacterium]
MNKQAPSAGKIVTMVAFAASCVGLLLFLWISFGGAVPFAAQGYRMKVEFKDAVQLGAQSDVRISGVSVGKVVTVSLDRHTGLSKAVIQIDPKYAPRPSDTRAAAVGYTRDPAGQVPAGRDLRRADAGLQLGAQAARRRDPPAGSGVGRRQPRPDPVDV